MTLFVIIILRHRRLLTYNSFFESLNRRRSPLDRVYAPSSDSVHDIHMTTYELGPRSIIPDTAPLPLPPTPRTAPSTTHINDRKKGGKKQAGTTNQALLSRSDLDLHNPSQTATSTATMCPTTSMSGHYSISDSHSRSRSTLPPPPPSSNSHHETPGPAGDADDREPAPHASIEMVWLD